MDGELQHMFHEHPLILKAESRKSDDDIDHSDLEISCEGCSTLILGPFYSCVQCPYFLHKVCAELPNELEHPIHPQHPLCLLSKAPAYYKYNYYLCNMCYETCEGFVYHCSICKFYVDTMCAATSHTITDKCHMHPLIPIQIPTSFFCHICIKKEKGVSYKCTSCPFWVHQNCIVLLPDTVKHSDHRHLLTLLPSVPLKYCNYIKKCDICYDELFPFQCSYYCERCKFFAHIHCGRSEPSSSLSRDQDDGQSSVFLPMKQDSTDSISRFVRKYSDGYASIYDKINLSDHEHPLLLSDMETCDNRTCDACAIAISGPSYGCDVCGYFLHKCCTDLPKQIDNHFFHKHPLLLIDEETSDKKTCDACATRISAPYYGCVVGCDYFLHKCCADLPKQIHDYRLHPQHQLTLQSAPTFFFCRCCNQYGNSFSYKCSECEYFYIDIKCAAILLERGVIYYEAHKHPFLIQRIKSSSTCTACGVKSKYLFIKPEYMLQCKTCSFELCIRCATTPAVIEHRYGGKSKEPFRLTYSPPENHFDDYLCEICLTELNPKEWYYHCLFGDQFAHVWCMVKSGADSNIKYGKSHMLKRVHEEHEVTTISCKYDCTPCSLCRHPMRINGSHRRGGVGFECKICNFRCHIKCPSD